MNITSKQLKQLQSKGAMIKGILESKPKKRGMNRLEQKYASYLEILKQNGEIIHWGFEEVTLKLADGVRFTPDFFVVTSCTTPVSMFSSFEFHETKGFLRDDARIKFQVARKQYPFFKFKMFKMKDSQWQEIYEDFKPNVIG